MQLPVYFAIQIRILDENDYLRNYSVFLMMFLFISIVCLTAALVISYTRCQTIAQNNRYVFDDLKRLGASPSFLLKEVKNQCSRIFRTPTLVGTFAMFFLYSLIMFGNDGKFTSGEFFGLTACFGTVILILGIIYAVYRITVKNTAQELNIK